MIDTQSIPRTQFINEEDELNNREEFIIPTLSSIKDNEIDLLNNNEGDKKGAFNTTESKTYNPTCVLLIKCVPYDILEIDIINLTEKYGVILDIYLVKHKGYAYIHFQDLNSALNCYKDFIMNKPLINKNTLHIFYTGKTHIVKPNTLISPPSRYLLIIFQKYAIPINNQYIQQLFAPFGICNKIVIFQAKHLQAFVEMKDIGQAIRSKENIENSLIPSVQLKILYIEQKDFYLHHQNHGSNPYLSIVPVKKNTVIYSMPDIDSPYSMPSFSPMHGFNGSPLMRPQNYNIPHWSETYESMQQMNDYYSPVNSLNMNHGNPVYGLAFANSVESMDVAEQFDQSLKINPKSGNMKGIKDCNIVLVKNLPRKITPIMLFRLFGMYGNVQKIKIFFKNPENALIEFSDHSQALLAKMHLNNCPLLGNNILVTISRQGIVINTNIKRGEENDLVADYTDSKDHRYKIMGSKNYKNIASPSKVLHLSNLAQEKDENFYKDLFKNYGTIIKIHSLKGESRMILMEMRSIEDAVSILVHFHNYNVDGKFLKVSFSKYQKIKD